MTHMQTKLSEQVFNFYVLLFRKTSLTGRREILSSVMQKYPEQYQEFIDSIDQKLYRDSVGQA